MEYGHTYPIIIFDADISSLLNNVLYYVAMPMTGCNMKRSLLERENNITTLCNLETDKLQKLTSFQLHWYNRLIVIKWDSFCYYE